jgi:thiol-disulfide isomerase/thioredoxin
MRTPAILKVVVAAAVLLAAKEAFPAGAPKPGDQAPEIKADDWLNTKPLTLAKLRGKIVIVEFWATWCPPCRKSIPHLIKLHEKYKDKGVVLVSLTNEPIGRIKSFVEKQEMTYAVGAGSKISRTTACAAFRMPISLTRTERSPGTATLWPGWTRESSAPSARRRPVF